MANHKRLGSSQRICLVAMTSRGHGGQWFPGCGWIWNTRSGTIRVMDSLSKAGMVVKSGSDATPVYTITEAGKSYLAEGD